MTRDFASAKLAAPPGDTWVGLAQGPLPVDEVRVWAARPSCGAVVVFTGIVRDHSEGRDGVTALTYEAWEAEATERLRAVVDGARSRWPEAVRVATLHRLGDVPLSEPTVVVAVSSPHRDVAFDAARFCIDTLKETVPVWKREHWSGGTDWAACDHDVRPVSR
ncbi:MAG TPA: molybdenum cofactor biosynthesis protein MoaE [Acidimicrobiia bacterium]|nr:molybdenum cofactor biosynthesis protein MoaE [Acidimicrobiia bacterium]